MKKYDIVEYSNDFATSISDYSAYELDLILCIICSARKIINNRCVSLDEDLELILDTSDIKKNMNGNVSSKRLEDALRHIFNTQVYIRKDNAYNDYTHLFRRLNFTDDLQHVRLILFQEHIKLFFNLISNYTKHSVIEITSLKGLYAKKIFQFICTYRKLGKRKFEVDFFKKALSIPEAYAWCDIDKRVLKTSKEEIKDKLGIDIAFKKIKTRNKITEIEISWSIKNDCMPEIENPFSDEEVKTPKKDLKAKPKPLTKEQEEEFERLVAEKKIVKPAGLRKGTDIYFITIKGILENYKKQEGEDEQK